MVNNLLKYSENEIRIDNLKQEVNYYRNREIPENKIKRTNAGDKTTLTINIDFSNYDISYEVREVCKYLVENHPRTKTKYLVNAFQQYKKIINDRIVLPIIPIRIASALNNLRDIVYTENLKTLEAIEEFLEHYNVNARNWNSIDIYDINKERNLSRLLLGFPKKMEEGSPTKELFDELNSRSSRGRVDFITTIVRTYWDSGLDELYNSIKREETLKSLAFTFQLGNEATKQEILSHFATIIASDYLQALLPIK